MSYILDIETGKCLIPLYWNHIGHPIGGNGRIKHWHDWSPEMPLVIETPAACREVVKLAVRSKLLKWDEFNDWPTRHDIKKRNIIPEAELNGKIIWEIQEVWGYGHVLEDNMMVAGFHSCFLGYMHFSARSLEIQVNDFDDLYMSAEFTTGKELMEVWDDIRTVGAVTEEYLKKLGFIGD